MIEPRTDPTVDISAENAFLWQVARQWRDPQPLANLKLDWQKVTQTAIQNKMPVLLARYLQAIRVQLPIAAADQLEASVEAYQQKAATFTTALRDYMQLARERDVPTIPLKGLWVAERVYGQPDMRPGHDMDILVRRRDVGRSVKICEQLGFDRYWPGLLPDDYYLRHHLHIELSLTDCWTWIEVHWAFDHPRTLLTIDYAAMFDRGHSAQLLGADIMEPAWEDVLLSLCIHLVKHMIFLPSTLARVDLADLILADGRMMHFLDVAETVKQFHEAIDWELLVQLARQSGAVASVGAVLHVCQRWFDAPVPPFVLAALSNPPQDRLTRKLHHEMANHLLGKSTTDVWAFLVEPNWKFVFRPIRLLDYVSYFAPPTDYLRRRYRRAGPITRIRHTLRAAFEYTQLFVDTVINSWRVRRNSLAPNVDLPPDSKCHRCD